MRMSGAEEKDRLEEYPRLSLQEIIAKFDQLAEKAEREDKIGLYPEVGFELLHGISKVGAYGLVFLPYEIGLVKTQDNRWLIFSRGTVYLNKAAIPEGCKAAFHNHERGNSAALPSFGDIVDFFPGIREFILSPEGIAEYSDSPLAQRLRKPENEEERVKLLELSRHWSMERVYKDRSVWESWLERMEVAWKITPWDEVDSQFFERV